MTINKGNITKHMAQSENSYWSAAVPSWHSQTFLHPNPGLAHHWKLNIFGLIAGLVNTTSNNIGPQPIPCCLVLLWNSILHSKQLLQYQNPHFIIMGRGWESFKQLILKVNSSCAIAVPFAVPLFLRLEMLRCFLSIWKRWDTINLVLHMCGIETGDWIPEEL